MTGDIPHNHRITMKWLFIFLGGAFGVWLVGLGLLYLYLRFIKKDEGLLLHVAPAREPEPLTERRSTPLVLAQHGGSQAPPRIAAEPSNATVAATSPGEVCRDPARTAAILARLSTSEQRELLGLMADQIDRVETATDKMGIEYSRYELGWPYFQTRGALTKALLPLAEAADAGLRVAVLDFLGKFLTLGRRNGALMLLSTGTNMRRYEQDNMGTVDSEAMWVCAQCYGRAKLVGGEATFERAQLIANSSFLPDHLAKALFMVEDRVPEEGVGVLIRGLEAEDPAVRSAAARSVGMVLIHYAEAAAPGLARLGELAADNASPGVKTAASEALECVARAQETLAKLYPTQASSTPD